MEADDLFQDLAIHILQKLQQEDDEALEKWDSVSWIVRITINFCLSELRKRKSKKNRSYKDLPDSDALDRNVYHHGSASQDNSDPSRSVIAIDIEELLSQMNERDRQLIILRIFEGKSKDEIDQIMGLTNSAQYYKRAIESLQKKIGVERYKALYDDFFPLEHSDDL